MDKDGLLKSIAEMGYNVGFGAKKHFATYDIVQKVPGAIGFVSMAIGVFALIHEPLSAKLPSACLVVAGVLALYISFFDHCKGDYEEGGRKLTILYNRLRDLYRGVQSGMDVTAAHATLKSIETEYYAIGVSNQIVGSDWYAHYKFFAQMQHDWIDEQKCFTWRDKVPLSLRTWVILLVVGGGIWAAWALLLAQVVKAKAS